MNSLEHEIGPPIYHLIIASSLVFDNDTIAYKFLNNSDFGINQLTIDANNIVAIEGRAFDTPIFSTVLSLTLNNLRVQNFSSLTLVGFCNLTYLRLSFLSVRFFNDILYPVSSTINYFSLDAPISGQIHHLNFGNRTYPNMAWANFGLNLRDSLRSTTFMGFDQLEVLQLRKCYIEVIEQDTFNAIRERIVELDLRDNQLHQLPVGVFALLLPKPFIIITIRDNPFICDCRLMELQILLLMYSNKFDMEVRCASPRLLENKLIAETTFCGDHDSNMFLQLECDSATIKISIMSTLNPTVVLRAYDLYIIMYKTAQQFLFSNDTYIVQHIQVDQIDRPVVRHFQSCPYAKCRLIPAPQVDTRLVMVCLTSGPEDWRLTPIQCVSLIRRCLKNIWIETSSKPLAITLIAVGICLVFVFGSAIGFGLLIRFPHWLRGGSQVKMVESNMYINPVPNQSDEV